MTKIYTDGSCLGNPGPGGWAWWNRTTQQSDAGYERHTTNNRMELKAILEAVKSIDDGRSVRILSDSRWAVEVLNRRWKAKKNRDLIEEVWAQERWPQCHLVWVRGHDGNDGNERADLLATAAARRIVA